MSLARAVSSVAEDPVLTAFLRAPVDDRPETEAERAAVEAAKVEAPGRMIPHAEVMASLERRRSAG
jgi:hypothetical protein